MDVRLPDGTVVRGVPEGTSRADLLDRLKRNGYNVAPLEPALSDAAQSYRLGGASGEPSLAEQAAGGAKHAWDRAAIGLKGIFTEPSADDRALLDRGKAFVRETGPASTVGQIGADVAMSAAPVARGARVLTRALGTMRGASVAGNVAANAGYAAVTAPEDRAEAAAFGALGATAGDLAARGAARIVRPITPGPQAQRLIDAGVMPTAGQALREKGPVGRALARVEESMESVPGSGSILRARREKALQAFQKATRAEALPPGAAKAAAETVDDLSAAFGKAYDGALHGVPVPPSTYATFSPVDEVLAAIRAGAPLAPPAQKNAAATVADIFETALDPAFGPPDAAAAHFVESRLKAIASNYKGSSQPADRDFGNVLHNVANEWASRWRAALPGEAADAIRAIDSQYAKFVPLRRAAATGSLTDPDAYTPHVLLRSLRAGDKSPNKSRFTSHSMPQQQLAEAGQSVLTSRVPDSGTAERALTVLSLGGGALTGTLPHVLGGMAGAAAYASGPTQKYLLGQYGYQRALSEALRNHLRGPAAQTGRAAATADR
jgi:hypothetical protein